MKPRVLVGCPTSDYKEECLNEYAEAVKNQVLSGMHATGDKVEEFEKKMAEFIGHKYAKATPSGTTAIHLALLAIGIKDGDEVIIPDYVCQSVMLAVMQTGAEVVLCDIENNYNISAKEIKKKITERTKVIIVPHMFGIPADMDSIMKLGIPVIEDCCQSLGAMLGEKKTGSLGDISIFSFYATKVISTGQGGIVLTSQDKIKEKIDDLTKYDHREKIGNAYNYGMTNLQGVLGIKQLEKLNAFIERRKEIGKKYDNAFGKEDNGEGFPFRYIIEMDSEKGL